MTRLADMLRGRTGLLSAVATGVVGGVLVLVASAATWAEHTFVTTAGGRQHVVVHGHDVAPSLRALAVAAIALTLALIATRSWARRLVGLLIVVVGGATIAVAVGARHDVAAALAHRAFGVAHPDVTTAASVWPWVAACGGLLFVAAGVVTTFVGGTWPGLGARYDAPTAPSASDEDAVWAALDRGDDPTV